MIHLTARTRRNIILFLAMFLTAVTLNIVFRLWGHNMINPSTELYEAIIIAWGLSARRRIISPRIRHALMGGALLLLALFVLRACRFDLLVGVVPELYLNYAYYIPLAMLPVMSLIAACYVDRTLKELPRRRFFPVWAAYLALCLLILTNERHFLFLKPLTPGTKPGAEVFVLGRGYPVFVIWIAGLTLASFIILLHRCSLSRCRRMWFIPVIPVAASCALFIWFGAVGGSPVVFGIKLYMIQEVYALFFIGFWEGCIQIGLIPTNTGYEELMDITSTGAVVLEGTAGPAEIAAASAKLQAGAENPEDIRVRSHEVAGGLVLWAEDLSVISHLNDELEDAAQRIEEENVLLAEENRIRGEQAALEVQNRLYDRIAAILRPQMNGIESLLGGQKESSFRLRVGMSAVLGAYVKRRANLEILSAQESDLSQEDLYYALKESSEYLELFGCGVRLMTEGSRRIPSELAVLAYEVFEEVVEQSLPGLRFLLTVLDVREGLELRMVLSPASSVVVPPGLLRRAEECSTLIRLVEEDDELNVQFRADTGLVLSSWSPREREPLAGGAESGREGGR